MSPQEVMNVLGSGKFDALIGTIESEFLEFKGSPYPLDSTKNKLELAKDVSSLANIGGGIIVIGVGTSFSEGYPHEYIERIRSFESKIINVKQYEEIIAKWIYPSCNVKIEWMPSQEDPNKGLVYIFMPESLDSQKPFLVVSVFVDDNKELGNVVGFFQRKGERVAHWSSEELHHAFKDGLRFDDHLSEIRETFEKILANNKTKQSTGIALSIKEQRIKNAISALGLKDNITYVLYGYPDIDLEIKGLFESRQANIVKLIDGPPVLRYAGFDISTYEQSRIIDGEVRRSIIKPYKLLEVWRDGLIIFVAPGDDDFLCWGNYNKQDLLKVNTIALVESVYLFILFITEVFKAGEVPKCDVHIGLQVLNIPKGRKFGLPKRPHQFFANFDLAYIQSDVIIAEETIRWNQEKVEVLAYRILCGFYRKFGLEDEFIPYVKEVDGQKVIDVDKIRNLR